MTLAPTAPEVQREKRFDWPLCDAAEQLILEHLASFTARHAFASELEGRMQNDAGTLLIDWTDHLALGAEAEASLRSTGYTDDTAALVPRGRRALWHPEAMLPRVLIAETLNGGAQSGEAMELALRCDSVADFIATHGLGKGETGAEEIEGAPLARLRRVFVSEADGARLYAVERRGYEGFAIEGDADGPGGAELVAKRLRAFELWRTRRRSVPAGEGGDAAAFAGALSLLRRIVALVGRDMACHIVFAVERDYWQARNHAARVQKGRQDALGLGWANHDHHTFRSSRRHFVDLMNALELLGFERRERYYAGAQAGWGAQILEQPVEGLVAFCDVDLEPEETEIDFSRRALPAIARVGTIGLWIGLHGESFLGAGMHHLECRFDYALLREQLAAAGVETMKPFSDFPFLKQAFTQGERWAVAPARAEALRDAGLITAEQCAEFIKSGAIGSHLENLQRKGGFKGFNQKSVSVIISATDPRLQNGH